MKHKDKNKLGTQVNGKCNDTNNAEVNGKCNDTNNADKNEYKYPAS
jgi:hypothetical protein